MIVPSPYKLLWYVRTENQPLGIIFLASPIGGRWRIGAKGSFSSSNMHRVAKEHRKSEPFKNNVFYMWKKCATAPILNEMVEAVIENQIENDMLIWQCVKVFPIHFTQLRPITHTEKPTDLSFLFFKTGS